MTGLPPGFAWAAMTPELLVTDLQASLRFWCGLCGFEVAYERPDDGFAYLDRDGCQFMLEQAGTPGRHWITGPLERSFGRGINFQIGVGDIDALYAAMNAAGWPLFLDLETVWYRARQVETGVRQFIVQDPDGYLLRFSQSLGQRPARLHSSSPAS